MARRVLAIEKSPLARNVYSMVLSKLDEIDLDFYDGQISDEKLREKVGRLDLVIVSKSTLAGKEREFCKTFRSVCEEEAIPCIVFVSQGAKAAKSVFTELKRAEIIEKPFFPDDFLKVVKKLWGIK